MRLDKILGAVLPIIAVAAANSRAGQTHQNPRRKAGPGPNHRNRHRNRGNADTSANADTGTESNASSHSERKPGDAGTKPYRAESDANYGPDFTANFGADFGRDFAEKISEGLGRAFNQSFGNQSSDGDSSGNEGFTRENFSKHFKGDFGENFGKHFRSSFDCGVFSGKSVPLAELDMSGPAPSAITLMGPDQVIVTQGEDFSVTIDGKSADAGALRFLLNEGMLSISRSREKSDADDESTGGKNKPAIVQVTVPSLEKITLAGSGEFICDGLTDWDEDEAQVIITGSGKAQISGLSGGALNVAIAGSGTCQAQGSVDSLNLNIAGSGHADLAELKAGEANVSIAGSGKATFASDGEVSAHIMGSGQVNVRGNARCTVQSFGSGSLVCESGDDADKAKPAAKKSARKAPSRKAHTRKTPTRKTKAKTAAKPKTATKAKAKAKPKARKKPARKSPKKPD